MRWNSDRPRVEAISNNQPDVTVLPLKDLALFASLEQAKDIAGENLASFHVHHKFVKADKSLVVPSPQMTSGAWNLTMMIGDEVERAGWH